MSIDFVLFLKKSTPQRCLLDLCMPGIDGIELARRIRALPDGHRHFSVALTVFSEEDHRDTAFAAGFNDFMTKPADLPRLPIMLNQFA